MPNSSVLVGELGDERAFASTSESHNQNRYGSKCSVSAMKVSHIYCRRTRMKKRCAEICDAVEIAAWYLAYRHYASE